MIVRQQAKLAFAKLCSCAILLSIFSVAQASVTLIGTRVIYPAEAKFVNLNFRSPDAVPSIIEVWTSLKNSASSTSQNGDGPFVVMPQVFRIDPKKGQTAKLTFTGAHVPQDRESVFYLNFVQLPAVKKDEQNANKLMVTYKSTMKIFYRPTTLTGDPNKVVSQLKIDLAALSAGSITVVNPSEYHVTISRLEIKQNGKHILSVSGNDLEMIAPFSQIRIPVKSSKINASSAVASIQIINDLGGISKAEISL
jgi:fimbrial chaperone protein